MKQSRVLSVIVIFTVMFIPAFASAAAFVHEPETQHTVTSIEDVSAKQEIFGDLLGHPHTFEFVVENSVELSVEVQIPEASEHKKSLIVIKEERRGVSEVGRISYNDGEWTEVFDRRLSRGFETQGAFETELGKGVYRVEVSSPENLGKYKLILGTESRWGYFDQFAHAWTGALFFGTTPFALLRAPIVLITFLVIIGLLYWGRRQYKNKYDTT